MPVVRFVASLLFVVSLIASPTGASQGVTAEIEALMAAYHEAGLFNGTVLVADGGEVIYEKGFGHADQSWSIPNGADTRFRIGSVTKQFTAALVLQLAEQGLIDLDAPLTTILPDYPAAQGDRVTVHQLLSHTAGIPEHVGRPGFDEIMRDPVVPDSFLSVFSGQDLDFEPGTAFRYSNSGYYLLGVLIEHVTGQPYALALQERLLGPLGLEAIGYDEGRDVLPQMARGYSRSLGGFVHAPYFDPSVPYAAGMMYATARALFRWTVALHAGEPFHQPETLDRMTTPVRSQYAYGLGVSDLPVGERPVRAIGHDGDVPGFSSFLVTFPDTDRTIVVLDNAGDRTQPIAMDLARVLYGQPVTLPTPSLSVELVDVIESEGIDAAVARYHDWVGRGAETTEDDLNGLGYAYLQRGDTATALRLFALNVEAYPESWNPHDSLGEAYLVAGDTTRAIASYQRALDLNPASSNARRVLESLGVEVVIEHVSVPVDVLDAYVGQYQVQPGFVVDISREGTQLYAQATGQPRFEVVPMSQTRFALTAVEAQLSFERDASGHVHRMVLHQGGRDTPADRVE